MPLESTHRRQDRAGSDKNGRTQMRPRVSIGGKNDRTQMPPPRLSAGCTTALLQDFTNNDLNDRPQLPSIPSRVRARVYKEDRVMPGHRHRDRDSNAGPRVFIPFPKKVMPPFEFTYHRPERASSDRLPMSPRVRVSKAMPVDRRQDRDTKDRPPQMSPRVRVSTPAAPVRASGGGNEDRPPQIRSKARVSKAMPVDRRHDRDTKDSPPQMPSRVRVSKATPVDRRKDRQLIPSSALLDDVNPRHGILAYLDNFRDGYAHEMGGGSFASTSSDLDFIFPDWDVFIADGSSSNAGSSQSNDEIHFLAKYVNTEEEGPDLDIYICKLEKGTNFAKQAARHLDVLQRTNGNSRLTTLTSYDLGNARIEDGGRLVEVFSVRISNNSNSRNYCRDIYGTIRVEHNGGISDGSYIFHRLRDDDKCISLYDDTLYLVGPPHVIYFLDFFEVTLNLKYKGGDLFPPDYENRCFALNGFFLPKDFEHGKLMCKEFRGNSGSATMYYTVFENAVEANVKVELFGGDRVYGSIVARYSHNDYSTDDEMKYYQSVLFHKKSSDYVKLKLRKVIPIPRAVAVPTNSSLVIEANLLNYNERKQDDRIAKGTAEFPPRAHGGTTVMDIKGDKGFARVTVAWKCAESFYLRVPPISF